MPLLQSSLSVAREHSMETFGPKLQSIQLCWAPYYFALNTNGISAKINSVGLYWPETRACSATFLCALAVVSDSPCFSCTTWGLELPLLTSSQHSCSTPRWSPEHQCHWKLITGFSCHSSHQSGLQHLVQWTSCSPRNFTVTKKNNTKTNSNACDVVPHTILSCTSSEAVAHFSSPVSVT